MNKQDYEYDDKDYNLDPSKVDWGRVSSDLFWCVWKRNNYQNDEETGATWFLQRIDDTVYLILEETRGRHSKDWDCNLDYYQVNWFSVKVHEGLLKQFLVFCQQFYDLCRENGVKHIRIAGYSLGGGIAQIAYYYAKIMLCDRPHIDIVGFNFEGPRALWLPYESEKRMFDNFYNIRSHNDLVIHSPAHVMIAPFFRIYVNMYPKFGVQFKWTGKFEISFWKYYGKQVWIGKWWKFLPYPHIPLEILKNLDRKFGTKCRYCEY